MANKKIGVMGYGEVGLAIAKFYKNPKIKDLNRDDGLDGVEILNICIPWSDKFLSIAKAEIKRIKPKLTIIHSTVPLNTTKNLSDEFAGFVVHSPVRGAHPDLFKGIKTFVKYIGADDKQAGKMAERHLKSLGIKTKLLFPSNTTEAIKLWDTTQYGWMIVLNKEIKKWCEKNKIDFDAVYAEANKSYNEGYKKFSRAEVVRPYLKYMPGPIGGHCVLPNCKMIDSEISKFILDINKKLAEGQ